MHHAQAGGTLAFVRGLRILVIFMGPPAEVVIGAEAGAGDLAAISGC